MSAAGLPPEYTPGRSVTCHACGYRMDAASEIDPGSPPMPHGPEVPVGSFLLCLACGAIGEVDPDGDMAPIPPAAFQELLQGEEGHELVNGLLKRTMLMSSPEGGSLHPFQRLGWKESDTPRPRTIGGVADTKGTEPVESLWAGVAVSPDGTEGICGTTALGGSSPMITGRRRIAERQFRMELDQLRLKGMAKGKRFQLRRYDKVETVEDLPG